MNEYTMHTAFGFGDLARTAEVVRRRRQALRPRGPREVDLLVAFDRADARTWAHESGLELEGRRVHYVTAGPGSLEGLRVRAAHFTDVALSHPDGPKLLATVERSLIRGHHHDELDALQERVYAPRVLRKLRRRRFRRGTTFLDRLQAAALDVFHALIP